MNHGAEGRPLDELYDGEQTEAKLKPLTASLGQRVEVWYTHTAKATAPDLLERYWSMLPENERARHDRFVFEKDKRLYLISRALVRWALSQYGELDPAVWRFVENGYGRPEVAPAQDVGLRFNLTHTSGLVACAVAEKIDIGVDAESMTRAMMDWLAIAKRNFAARELAQIHALCLEEQRAAFLKFWTLKEAYIKARGLGLSLPLNDFAFELRPGEPPAIHFENSIKDDPDAWQFAQFFPTAEHTLAVAVRKGEWPNLSIVAKETVPLL